MEKHVGCPPVEALIAIKTIDIYIYNIDILEYAGFVRGSAV